MILCEVLSCKTLLLIISMVCGTITDSDHMFGIPITLMLKVLFWFILLLTGIVYLILISASSICIVILYHLLWLGMWSIKIWWCTHIYASTIHSDGHIYILHIIFLNFNFVIACKSRCTFRGSSRLNWNMHIVNMFIKSCYLGSMVPNSASLICRFAVWVFHVIKFNSIHWSKWTKYKRV